MEALSFVSPVAYALDWLLFFSDKSKLLTIGIVSTAGVLLGSAAWALVSRSFRWEGFSSVEDTASHMVGAALMGVGGVTALGCTIGQGVSGLSTLALGSFVAFGGHRGRRRAHAALADPAHRGWTGRLDADATAALAAVER